MLLLWLAALLTLAGLAGLLVTAVVLAIARWRGHEGSEAGRLLGRLALAMLVGGLLLLGLPRLVSRLTTRQIAFELAFGIWAPQGIGQFDAAVGRGFDFTTIFIALPDSPAARSLLNERFGQYPSGPESDLAGSLVDGGDAPDWWKGGPQWIGRNTCADRQGRELHDWREWSDVVIIDCRSDRRIYLLFNRID